MVWVVVFVAIALAGLLMVIGFAVWLMRKASALLAEVGVLAERADELAGLVAQIQPPDGLGGPQGFHRFGEDDGFGDHDVETGVTSSRAT